METAESLKSKVHEEAERKLRESVAANSLPANLDQAVEKPVVKSSADEVTPRPAQVEQPEATGGPQAAPAAEAEYVSPSLPLKEKPNKKKRQRAGKAGKMGQPAPVHK